MNFDIDTDKLRTAAAEIAAQLRQQNTPEALAARAAAERNRKIARGIGYRRQCDARDAAVLGAKVR